MDFDKVKKLTIRSWVGAIAGQDLTDNDLIALGFVPFTGIVFGKEGRKQATGNEQRQAYKRCDPLLFLLHHITSL